MAPTYDFAVHNRSDIVRPIDPAPVIVVEGILVLHDPALREHFDLKVFVDADSDIRFIRRLKRDVEERGRTPDSIVEQYLATVRPGHEQFIEPSKRYADVILPGGGENEPAIELLWRASRTDGRRRLSLSAPLHRRGGRDGGSVVALITTLSTTGSRGRRRSVPRR